MPWKRENDGLKLVGDCHYNEGEIRALIGELRTSRNQPEEICKQLEKALTMHKISKQTIWRLSKWCDWNDKSAKVARSIAGKLFHGHVCRRLLDQEDRPKPDSQTAETDYELWLNRVVTQRQEDLQSDLTFLNEEPDPGYQEGKMRRVFVNAYERNSAARAKCIKKYGAKCSVCGFEFAKRYNGVGKGFIHVHHLKPLSAIGEEYEVDPENDLRPVCPNCHAMLHLYKEPFSIEQLKARLINDEC